MALIVVIEDNAENARLAAKLLRHAGHEVIIAEDGEVGLTTVFEHRPDLVLIDLGLPDIDGQTVVGLVRQQPELKSVPLIAFTAWPEDTAHTMARAYGCDGIITKPMNTRTFAQQIADYMAEKRAALAKASEATPETASETASATSTPSTSASQVTPAPSTVVSTSTDEGGGGEGAAGRASEDSASENSASESEVTTAQQ